MRSSSILTVDLSVIHSNLKKLTAHFGQVMVMVKANAYGTDPIFLSKYIKSTEWNGVPFVGVSHVEEGVRLREGGVTLPIFVIAAPPYDAEWVAVHQLTPAVSSFEEIEALNLAANKYEKIIPVRLHLNTGLNRFGIALNDSLHLYRKIKSSPHLLLEGVMTHFAAAESPEFDFFTCEQIRQFKQFLDYLSPLPRWIHAANSGGAVRFPMPFCNLVRIGLGVIGYGICLEGIKPSLTLSTTLASITLSKKGETVGYNRTYTIKKEKARIGVIPVGYHDGFHRILSGKGYVLIHGKKAPMIGTICMDFMMIDLTDIPEARVGDEVLLFCPELSPHQIAAWGMTDVRELLVSLPMRVKRKWKYNDDATNTSKLSSSFLPFEKNSSPR